ncbi:hypothetical protein MHM89_16400 [Pseudoalteromonas sp. CNC9-20]|uniref:hypothetical protein n=1 Tax=Pseudoalteromonas sp. CNC9-20 TaxID=2917750 RepID=UPI001EF543EC|nr:hypothetical protein [Pseudoalteromonas sp. CNC9-20]MCG7571485.1 hypothetical protein [Pseudoalteromonas sp. CNC9-20]
MNASIPGKVVVSIINTTVPVGVYFDIDVQNQAKNATFYHLYENGALLATRSNLPIKRYPNDTGERYYQVQACNNYGCGPVSDRVTVIIGRPVTQKPVMKLANTSVFLNKYFDIDIKTTIPNASFYNLYENGKLLAKRDTLPISRYMETVNVKRYQIEACNEFGCGPISDGIDVSVEPFTIKNGTVKKSRAIALVDTSIRLEAHKPQESIFIKIGSYPEVAMTLSTNGEWIYNITNLTAGNYSLTIRAIDKNGNETIKRFLNEVNGTTYHTFNLCNSIFNSQLVSQNRIEGELMPEQFGAHADGTHDDFEAFKHMLKCSSGEEIDKEPIKGDDSTNSVIKLAPSTYCINSTLNTHSLFGVGSSKSTNRSVHIVGAGKNATILKQCDVAPDSVDIAMSMFKADYRDVSKLFRIDDLSAQGIFLQDSKNERFHKWLSLPFSEAWEKSNDCSNKKCKSTFDNAFVNTISSGNIIAKNISTSGFVYGFELESPRGFYFKNIANDSFLHKLVSNDNIIERIERPFGAPFNKLFSSGYACINNLAASRSYSKNPCDQPEKKIFNGEQNGGNWNAAIRIEHARSNTIFDRVIRNVSTSDSGAAVVLGSSSNDVKVSDISCNNIHDNCVYVSSGQNVRINGVNGMNVGGALVKGRGSNIGIHDITGDNVTIGVNIQSLRPGEGVTSADITGVKVTNIRSDGVRIQHHENSGSDIIYGANVCDIDVSFSATMHNDYTESYEQYSYSGIWVGSDVAEGKVSSINVGTCDQVYGGNAPDSFNPTNPKSTFPLFSNDILINKANAKKDSGILFIKNVQPSHIKINKVIGIFPNESPNQLFKWVGDSKPNHNICQRLESERFNCISVI